MRLSLQITWREVYAVRVKEQLNNVPIMLQYIQPREVEAKRVDLRVISGMEQYKTVSIQVL